MSSLLQNECELLVNVAAKLLTASANGDLRGCYDIIDKSIPSLGPYISWEVVCDLLEARILGRCTEDMYIPYVHPLAKGKISLHITIHQSTSTETHSYCCSCTRNCFWQ